MANGLFGGGDGTEGKPYLVEDAMDFDAVRHNLFSHFVQTKNISLAEFSNWIPLDRNNKENSPFSGVYDGANKIISDIVCIHNNEDGEASLFGSVGDGIKEVGGAKVPVLLKNIKVVKADMVGAGYASILITHLNRGNIADCSVSGRVRGKYAAGFFIGLSDNCIIERCSANTDIAGVYAGGFSAWGASTWYDDTGIYNCYSTGTIRDYHEIMEETQWAWLAGFASGSASACVNCYSTSKINCDRHVGSTKWTGYGATFFAQGLGVNCYGDIDKKGGDNVWDIDYSYMDPDNVSNDCATFARGTDGVLYVCIKNQMNIDNDYWDPAWNENGPPSWHPGPFDRAQPVAGSIWSEYWAPALDYYSDFARTTEQMMSKDNYIGWDFKNVWEIKEGISYPTLRKPKIAGRTQCNSFEWRRYA